MDIIFWLMNLGTVVTVYVFWVRPLLKKNPTLGALYAKEGRYFAAFSLKFDGIKQRLLHAFIGMAGFVVVVYDDIAPKITGIDTTPLTTMLSHHIPDWGWPIIMIGFAALMDWFRRLADKAMEEKIEATVQTPRAPDAPAAPGS